MYLLLIILLGFLLRISYILKPEGLWNDEYVSWAIASTPFTEGFWNAILKQCHMPLYYLYLKLFGDNDLVLRISSIIPSIISIFVMYKIGTLKSKSLGYLLAFITSVSGFLIYYSQEVRFYSLLFLFSSILLYYLLKTLATPSRKNAIGYIISSALILFTHTIGFIFVACTTIYLLTKIKLSKQIITTITVIFCTAIPLSLYIFTHTGVSQWWSDFSYRNLVFMMTDFFSPILTNNVNIPAKIFYNTSPLFIIHLVIPTLIACTGIILALINNKQNRELFYICVTTTTLLALSAITGKFVFITKYNIEILPILMFLFAQGVCKQKSWIKWTLILTWCGLQLTYFLTPSYPTKLPRTEGNRLPAILLAKQKITSNDQIIFTYYNNDRFSKYINLQNFNILNIDKTDIAKYVSDNRNIPPEVYIKDRTFLNNQINSIINQKKRTFVLFLDSVTFFSDEHLITYIEGKTPWKNIHPIYLELSVFKNELIKYGKSHDFVVKSTKMGSWTLISLEVITNE